MASAKGPGPLTFKVKCEKGYPFPVDMLRYDSAVPATEVDSDIITQTLNPEILTVGPVVELKSYAGSGKVTTERWESFGWEVVLREAGK